MMSTSLRNQVALVQLKKQVLDITSISKLLDIQLTVSVIETSSVQLRASHEKTTMFASKHANNRPRCLYVP